MIHFNRYYRGGVMEKKEKVRQVRAAETRRKIVAAAKKLITEKGFESVAIEDIAKEAGVS
ncbi:MAG: TetR family transcriptional regulator, partial [Lachnospiraceae bacterium]